MALISIEHYSAKIVIPLFFRFAWAAVSGPKKQKDNPKKRGIYI